MLKFHMKKISFLIIIFFLYFVSFSQNADSTWFVNNYTKMERYITMRDGVRLFTSVYMPRDTAGKHPVLMIRTPYSCAPYGEDKFIRLWYSYLVSFAKENFIFVWEDVRGRYMSEGE